MIRNAIASLWPALISLLLFLSPAASASSLTMSLDRDTLVVSGVTPGGKAVFFGVQKFASSRGHFDTSRRYSTIEQDGDGDGVVRYAPEGGVTPSAVWSATDFSTGALVTFVPAGLRAPIPLPGRGVHPGVAGVLNQLSTSLRLIEVVIIRPDKGVWIYTAGEGGRNDAGPGSDGKIDVTADRFSPLIGGERLGHFLPRDVLVVIDVPTMRYHTSQVNE